MHFPMLCCPTTRGKTEHHWGSKYQVAKLYRSCVSLSIENKISLVHHIVKHGDALIQLTTTKAYMKGPEDILC
jgi:hypothetical protein